MRDVKPIAGRDRLRPPPVPERAPRTAPPGETVRLEVEERGDRIEGRAPGVSNEQLRKLRTGGVPVDTKIDLHGLNAADARREVERAVRHARETGARCLLVVHGKGLHSEQGPVLKQALPEWLSAPPLAGWITAFTSADHHAGGTGATYVLLRRQR